MKYQLRLNPTTWGDCTLTTWLMMIKTSQQMEFRYSLDDGITWVYIRQIASQE